MSDDKKDFFDYDTYIQSSVGKIKNGGKSAPRKPLKKARRSLRNLPGKSLPRPTRPRQILRAYAGSFTVFSA